MLLGATRKGKTTFARKLILGLLDEQVAAAVLVHDQKHPERQQFEGKPAVTIEEARALVAAGEQTVICRAPITVEEVAQVVRDLVESGVPAAAMVDEVTPALKSNGIGEPTERVWCGPSPAWICLQGGGLGASFLLNAQLPKVVPGSMLDSAEAFVCFNLGGRSLEYAADQHLIPRAAIPTVVALSEGEFCIFRADQEWDGTIYGPR